MRTPLRPGTYRLLAAAPLSLALLVLSGCATTEPPAKVDIAAPPQWYANLPHNGSLTSLSQWWQQQNDALLVDMINAAQQASPSVVAARSNIQQAQASQTASRAALLPSLDAVGSATRGRTTAATIANSAQLGLQTSWEIDLFGQNQASLNADGERLLGSQALWHEARILVAAEVASQYYSWRTCQQLLAVTSSDAKSRFETSRLADLLTQAGFGAPATAALARATAAEGNSRVTQQRAECDFTVKALVALTGWPEPELRQKLALSPSQLAPVGMLQVSSVPADVLSQRPDVYNAAREVSAASYEVGSARAQRYPRLSISGTIAGSRTRARGVTQRFTSWSVGPLALTVPLFDGGAADANVDASKARYEEAAGKYRGVVRQAVREVEEALVTLQGTTDRSSDTLAAADGYRASFAGTEARYKAGLASLVELEEARRVLLAAQSGVVLLERERRFAWITLYKALGGGWSTAAAPPAPIVYTVPEAFLPDW